MLQQNLFNTFSSKSSVITVDLQLCRTFNLFGLPYVAALLLRARFHGYFVQVFIVFPANPNEVADYTLDHVVPGSSPDLWVEGNTTSLLIPYHEQVR